VISVSNHPLGAALPRQSVTGCVGGFSRHLQLQSSAPYFDAIPPREALSISRLLPKASLLSLVFFPGCMTSWRRSGIVPQQPVSERRFQTSTGGRLQKAAGGGHQLCHRYRAAALCLGLRDESFRYGRGRAIRMGIISAMIAAGELLLRGWDRDFAISSSLARRTDSIGGVGAKMATRVCRDSGRVCRVVGEPTESTVRAGLDGGLYLLVRFYDRRAFAYPEPRDSAINNMVAAIAEINAPAGR